MADRDRLMICFVSQKELVTLIRRGDYLPEVLEVPYLDVLPEGAEVVTVHPNPARMGFDVILYHTSFGEVPTGHEIPRLNNTSNFQRRMVRLISDTEGVCLDQMSYEAIEELKVAVDERVYDLRQKVKPESR